MAIRHDLFTHTLNSLRMGEAQEELSKKLHECVCEARDVGKSASITLTITIKPNGKGQFEVLDKIITKLPTPDKGVTLMYDTPDGNLQRENPRQHSMELRAVPQDAIKDLKRPESA